MDAGTFDNNTAIWKINGVTQSNQTSLVLDQAIFASGAPVVVESIVPLNTIILDLSGTNESGIAPYHIKVEPVAGGNPQPVINIEPGCFVQAC